jgi:dTDP-4-dehydrorhamnose reductase
MTQVSTSRKKTLILGASGMLGNAVYRVFAEDDSLEVTGTTRTSSLSTLGIGPNSTLVAGIDAENFDSLVGLFSKVKPEVVINCVGLVKQIDEGNDVLSAIPINAMLPHRLARLCALIGARFIHVSTDCVFSGSRGGYSEADVPDAPDVYGRSKLLGEVDYPNAVTLRTSIIGHELRSGRGLIDWFLAQHGEISGFKRAFFSGLPTVELATVIKSYVMPNPDLRGVFHVSAESISKYDLLTLVAKTYGKSIQINPNESFVIDRSLDSTRFRKATGYQAPHWPELVQRMHQYFKSM